MVTVTGRSHLLTRQWADALADVIVRHPNPNAHAILTLEDAPQPMLTFEIDRNLDSRDPTNVLEPFRITNVRLSFFPGVTLARKWLAAGWAGFLQHEALELVTIGDFQTRALDPHETREALDYVFHTCLPEVLTRDGLIAALSMMIPPEQVRALAAAESAMEAIRGAA